MGHPVLTITLPQLVPFLVKKAPLTLPEVAVTGITQDPMRVGPGHVFVDVLGQRDAWTSAVHRGAVAVVAETSLELDPGVPVLLVQDARRALAHMADRLYGHPSRELKTCGVTGTFGKSSVLELCAAALQGSGLSTGIIDAAGSRHLRRERLPVHLRALRDAGTDACVMEVTSRDLAAGRLDAVHFQCGVFTNFHPRHLEWHGSLQEYLDAKLELFRKLGDQAVAVINRDDPCHELVAEETAARIVTFGVQNGGDIRARVLGMSRNGMHLEVRTPLGRHTLRSPLFGHHQVSNLLAALASALALGADVDAALRGLESVDRLQGRLERVQIPAPYSVYVDASPSPHALKCVLRSLKGIFDGKIWVVIGSSASQSPALRRSLAATVERHADEVVVTSENPGLDNPMSIIKELMSGFQAPRSIVLEPDRRSAIELALDRAAPGDVVLVAGRGAERVQWIDGGALRLDDRDVVLSHFLEAGGAALG